MAGDGWTRVSTKKRGRERSSDEEGGIFFPDSGIENNFVNKRHSYYEGDQTGEEKNSWGGNKKSETEHIEQRKNISEHTEQEMRRDLKPSEQGGSKNSESRKRKAEQKERMLRHTLEQEQKKINIEIDAIEEIPPENYDGRSRKMSKTTNPTNNFYPNDRKVGRKMLLDENRRSSMPERMDRRRLWTKATIASTNIKDKNSQKEVQFTPEELDHLSKLALRLHLNGIDINTMELSTQDNKKKCNLKELLVSPEIRRQMEDWKEDSWEEFNILNVESELPSRQGDINQKAAARSDYEATERDTIIDVPPVLYGKLKGVHAKVLVDQGAKVTVISQKFAEANGVGWSRLHAPVKLSMAN